MSSATEIDSRPGSYYVTCRNDVGKVAWLLGPFPAHAEALAMVGKARRLAATIDPWTAFYAFGTARIDYKPGETPFQGKLNSRLDDNSQQKISCYIHS